MAPHSDAVSKAVTVALQVICWRKKDLKAFVELTPNVGDIVAAIQWKKRSRREIATELVDALTEASGKHAGQLDNIVSRICDLSDSFIDEKNLDDSARREAKKAVMALRDVMGFNGKTAIRPSDMDGTAKDHALAAPSPADPNGVAPADADEELVNRNDVGAHLYLSPSSLFALICCLLVLVLLLVGTRQLMLVWVLLSMAWYLALGWRTLVGTLSRMSRHWFPMTLFGLVCLMSGGHIGAYLGIQNLFHDDPEVGFSWNSPAFWGAFGATVLVGEIWIIVYLTEYISNYTRLDTVRRRQGWDWPRRCADLSQDISRFNDPRPMVAFLLANLPPFLGLYVLCAAFPTQARGENVRSVWIDLLVYTAGIGVGLGTLALLLLVGFGLAWLVRGRHLMLRAAGSSSRWLGIDESLATQGSTDPRAEIAVAFWLFLLMVLVAAVGPLTWRLIVPSLAISVLFGLVLSVYFVLASLKRSLQVVLVLIVVAYASWSNSGTYKFQFPNMIASDGTSLYDRDNLLQASRSEADGPGPDDPLLDNVSVLRRWKGGLKDKKPKIVLVAVTGGAYRSGFWAAAVLDELTRRSQQDGSLPGFTDRIRLITGASGGMVGAGYFVTLHHTNKSVVDAMLEDSSRDSLTPAVQQMVQRDIPMIFCPTRYQSLDRGRKLEEQWKTIARPFHDTYMGEREGRCPSLIVSPMVVETGERMLISNLDLEDITTPVSTTGELYLASARQFYRMFPTTQSTFGLNTAVRMNASFPYISPAVSLPTSPVRRLVDAGYYDNYGVNLAAAWAYEYRDWIRSETSGVALIQIHASPRTDPAQEDPAAKTSRGKVRLDLTRSFSWLTSPVEGALGARDWSMLYRNEEQLRMLESVLECFT
jgi:hypothetical protein